MLTCLTAAVLLAPSSVSAQGRRARLSEDLADQIRTGGGDTACVILPGSHSQIDTLAARHGLRVRKRLAAGALVDVWHSDNEGHYDVDVPGQVDPAMRGSFRTDDQGCFTFRSIRPSSYPIPGDGTVGELMRTTARSLMRPAHVHFLIDAPGFQRVTTMLFPSDDAHLDTDPVFGVKQSLVTVYEQYSGGGGPRPDQSGPYTLLRHTFVLAPAAGR